MNIFQVQAILDSYRSMKDKGLRITFDTGELSPELMANIHYGWQKYGFLIFSADPFTSQQIEELNDIKIEYQDEGKPPSQRLRAVLYRCWEQKNEGYETFIDYYNVKMEKLINHFKNKLD